MLDMNWRNLLCTILVLFFSGFGILTAQKRQNSHSSPPATGVIEASLQQLYDSSVQAQDQGDWNRARALLAQIQQSAPEYKDVKKRMVILDSLLALEVAKAQTLREQLRASGAALNLELTTGESRRTGQARPETGRDRKTAVTLRTRDKFDITLTPPPDLAAVQKVNENLGLNPESVGSEHRNESVAASETVQGQAPLEVARATVQKSDTVPEPARLPIAPESSRGLAAIMPAADQNPVAVTIDLQRGFSMLRRPEFIDSAGPNESPGLSLWPVAMVPRPFLLSMLPEPELSAPDTVMAMTATQYDSLYRCALILLERNDWHNADIILKKLYSQNPAYRNLSVIYNQVQKHRSPWLLPDLAALVATVSKSGALFFIAILIIGFMGYRLLNSPVLAARLWLRLGRTEVARKLCEKVVIKSPRPSAYSCLACIYLKLGRTDAAALKVYQIALKLNPDDRQSKQLRAILAQNYLSANRSDADAVEVMEKVISTLLQNKDKKA